MARFDIDVPEIDTRSAEFVRRGVESPSPVRLAADLVKIGEETFTRYQEEKLKDEVEKDVTGFFSSAEEELASGVAVPVRRAEAEATLSQLEQMGGLAAEDRAKVEELRAQIARLKKLEEVGSSSALELRARAESTLAQYKNRYPGLSREFQAMHDQTLSDYASRVAFTEGQLQALRSSKDSQEDAQKKYMQAVADHHNIYVGAVTEKHVADYQHFGQMENAKTLLENANSLKDEEGKLQLRDVDQQMVAVKATGLHRIMSSMNQGVYNGVDISAMTKSGMAVEDILGVLQKNSIGFAQYKNTFIQNLSLLKRQVLSGYDQFKLTKGLPLSVTTASKDAAIADIDMIIEGIKNDTTGELLLNYVKALETGNKGRAEVFNAANMAFFQFKQIGIISDDFLTIYTNTPERLSPELRKMMDNIMANAEVGNRLVSNFNMVSNDPKNLKAVMDTDPTMAGAVAEIAERNIDQTKIKGWSTDPTERRQQMDKFAGSVGITLEYTKGNPTASYEQMNYHFNDKRFLDKLRELPVSERERAVAPIMEAGTRIIASDSGALAQLRKEIDLENQTGRTFWQFRYNPDQERFEVYSERPTMFSKPSKGVTENLNVLNNTLKVMYDAEVATGAAKPNTFGKWVEPVSKEWASRYYTKEETPKTDKERK